MGLSALNEPKRRPSPPRRRSNAPGIAARRCAIAVFEQVLKARAALDETLDAAIAEARLDARDGGLVRAIATASFRHLGSIRAILAERLAEGLPKSSGPLEAILVTGAAQILHLDVPDHSAVDIAVDLTREDNRSAPYGKLANAVLRRIASDADRLRTAFDPLRHDTPAWLAERWVAAYGAERAKAIAAANGREAALDITVLSEPADWARRLGAELLPTGSLRLADRRPVRELEGFDEGRWWVQDAAAALPARLLGVAPGTRVLDLCAAPGGKTAQLAAAGAEVVAVDRSARRLERLTENLARLGLEAQTLAADAAALDIAPADAVLLDAPCSATGTLRRHPEVAWVKGPEDVARLAGLQVRLLDNAAKLVKPGGRLLYCVCSLEAQEGEGQVAAFLARTEGFRLDPVSPDELPGLAEAVTGDGLVRTLPSMWARPEEDPRLSGLDGFFVARFVKS